MASFDSGWVGRAALWLAFLSLTSACNTVTRVSAPARADSLQRVAVAAEDEFTVTWIDENTLEISDWWPTHSILTVGYSRFRADMRYSAGRFDAEFYLLSNQLGNLFLPSKIGTGPGFLGGALKPYMRKQMRQVLDWAGIPEDNCEMYDTAP